MSLRWARTHALSRPAVVCATVMASLTAYQPTDDIALLAIRAAEGNAATGS
ncbi:hypothetical protein [Micromonospora sp. NPDC005087]|uniref:hypothetical protein n=1 Tax=Micromonospora sp. NPDC005087 TaxID=3364225 RepID=UPI0036B70E37